MNKIRYIFIAFFFCIVYAQNEPFALGADISWIQQKEKNTRYYHDGQAQDMLDILKEHGFNYIRLRLFVDPAADVPEDVAAGEKGEWRSSPYSAAGYCGLDSTVKMAKRIKAAGFKFLLDFHYSDTWADPGKQYKPVSWRGLNFTQLTAKVRSYTKESLEAFRDDGALPDMVQVGNEVVGGMIHPDGSGNSANFATLVNAGINGVKDVDANIKIMMHTISKDNPNWWLTTLKTNLNKAEANAANKVDVFGLSYYPKWHGNLDSLQRVLNTISNNHNIKIAVVEYADKHREVNDMVFALPADKRLGTFVWEPQEFDGDNSIPLFDWRNNPAGRHSNARLELYPQMAIDYGLAGISSSSARSSSSSGTTPVLLPQNAANYQTAQVRIQSTTGNAIVLENLPDNAKIEVYNLRGERVYTNAAGAKNLLPLHIPVHTKGVYIIKISTP